MRHSPEDKRKYLEQVVDGALDIGLGAYLRNSQSEVPLQYGVVGGARATDTFGFYSASVRFSADSEVNPQELFGQRSAVRESLMALIVEGIEGYPLDRIPYENEIINSDGSRIMPPRARAQTLDKKNNFRASNIRPYGPFAYEGPRPDHPLYSSSRIFSPAERTLVSSVINPTVLSIYGRIPLEGKDEPVGRWEVWTLKD